MATTFEQTYEAQLGHSPLQYGYGQAWLKAHGAIKDSLLDRLRTGVKSRFAPIAPSDAIQALGIERGIIRGLNETDAAYAARVVNAWTAWPFAGTAYGLLQQLWIIGYTSTVLASRGTFFTLDVNGSPVYTTAGTGGWQPGYPNQNSPFWNVFTVIVPHPWPSTWLSAGNWAAPVVVGAGTGTVSGVTGLTSTDANICVLINVGGTPGGAAQYKISTDGGVTFGGPISLGTTANGISGSATFNASGTFTLNDRYYLSQIPPGDSSADASIFRAVIKTWKPGHAICNAVTVLQTGRVLGYPVRNLGSSNGVLGGCSTTSWTPPS